MPSWFLRLLVVRALASTTISLVRPMTSYLTLALGGNAASVGFIAAAFGMAPLVAAVPLGRWVDRGHSERYVFGGLAGVAAATALLAFTGRIWQIAGLSALLGLSNLVAMLASQALLAGRSEDQEHDRRFGLFTMVAAFGQLAGPLIGGYVAARSGTVVAAGAQVPVTTWSLLVGASLATVAAACVVGLRGPSTRADTAPRPTVRQIGQTRGVPQAIFVSLSLVACINVIIVYLPVLGQQRGLAVSTVGVLLALRGAASMVSRAWASTMVRRFGRRRLLIGSMLLAAAGLVLMPLPGDIVLLAVLMAGAGFFLGIGSPLTMTWVVHLVVPQVRGTALALRLTGNRIGQVAIPAVAGLVAGPFGVSGVFWLLGGLLGAATLTVARTGEDDTRPDEPGK